MVGSSSSWKILTLHNTICQETTTLIVNWPYESTTNSLPFQLKARLNGFNIFPTFVQQNLNGCWAKQMLDERSVQTVSTPFNIFKNKGNVESMLFESWNQFKFDCWFFNLSISNEMPRFPPLQLPTQLHYYVHSYDSNDWPTIDCWAILPYTKCGIFSNILKGHAFSTRECLCPLVRLVRLDNRLLRPFCLTNTDWYFLRLSNKMYFSTRQFTLSTRQCLCPLVRLDNRSGYGPSALQIVLDIS